MKTIIGLSAGRLAVLSLAISLTACTTPADTESSLQGNTEGSNAFIKNVPGSHTSAVTTLVARVAHIDYKKRTLQLLDDMGNRKTLAVGPEAINFPQIKKGDVVKVAFVDELLIYLREKGAAAEDGAVDLIAKAPEGEKPQVLAAQEIELTAVVTNVDLAKHTATLKFPDGSVETVPVREDVKLDKKQVGREVVFRRSHAMAISVESP